MIAPSHAEQSKKADLTSLKFTLVSDRASASLRSVLDVLPTLSSDTLEHLVDAFSDLIASEVGGSGVKLIPDFGDLFVVEPVDRAALGTDEVRLAVNPSDRYLDLVAAVAGDDDVSCNLDVHGWPILSVVARTSTVAEPAEVTILGGGGLA